MDKELENTWVEALLRETYFGACSSHISARKNECNVFCAHCQAAICQHCLPAHRSHYLFQIRRYVYNDVIRLDDIQHLVDCEHVQAYIVNSAKVVFLNQRPQSRPAKGAGNGCRTCDRILQEGFHFCSLACRVEAAPMEEKKSRHGLFNNNLLMPVNKRSGRLSPNSVLPDATSSSFSPSSSVSTANDTELVAAAPLSISHNTRTSSKLSTTIGSFKKNHLITWNSTQSNQNMASSSKSSESPRSTNLPVALRWARTLRWPSTSNPPKSLPFTHFSNSFIPSKLTSGQITHIRKFSYSLEQSLSDYLDAKPFLGSAQSEYLGSLPLPKRRKGTPQRSPIC